MATEPPHAHSLYRQPLNDVDAAGERLRGPDDVLRIQSRGVARPRSRLDSVCSLRGRLSLRESRVDPIRSIGWRGHGGVQTAPGGGHGEATISCIVPFRGCARGGIRTPKRLPSPDPKSGASARFRHSRSTRADGRGSETHLTVRDAPDAGENKERECSHEAGIPDRRCGGGFEMGGRREGVGGSTKRGGSGRIDPPRVSDDRCTVERIVRSADGRGS